MLSSQIPDVWKWARIKPVYKKGDKLKVSNYRPVSITCACCKLLEHIVAGYIQTFLVENNVLSSLQHGFRKGLSTVTQLVTVVHEFSNVLDNAGQVDVVFLDFCKSFDKVSQSKLLSKLTAIGLPAYLVNWVREYLKNRMQFVMLGNAFLMLCLFHLECLRAVCWGPFFFFNLRQ